MITTTHKSDSRLHLTRLKCTMGIQQTRVPHQQQSVTMLCNSNGLLGEWGAKVPLNLKIRGSHPEQISQRSCDLRQLPLPLAAFGHPVGLVLVSVTSWFQSRPRHWLTWMLTDSFVRHLHICICTSLVHPTVFIIHAVFYWTDDPLNNTLLHYSQTEILITF